MSRIDKLDEQIESLQEKMNFVSVMNGKLVGQMEYVMTNKVDKVDFEVLIGLQADVCEPYIVNTWCMRSMPWVQK